MGIAANAVAMKESHWCYFHARLHDQNAQRLAREAERRSRYASSRPRLSDGTFAPGEDTQTLDGACSVGGETESAIAVPVVEHAAESVPLRIPNAEDSASIQLALVEVLHALAANQIDPRRAGLLLYGLQVAAANAKNVHFYTKGPFHQPHRRRHTARLVTTPCERGKSTSHRATELTMNKESSSGRRIRRTCAC